MPSSMQLKGLKETRRGFVLKETYVVQTLPKVESVGVSVLPFRRICLRIRIGIGRVPLSKVPEGQWRYLQRWEKF